VPLAEFWYNSSNHSTLGHSPFELLYGHQPRHFGISSAQVYQVPELATWLQERQIMMQAIRQHLHRVQIRMKDQADKKRSEASFEVGEWVFSETSTLCAIFFSTSSSPEVGIQVFWAIQDFSQDWISCVQTRSPCSQLDSSSVPCISAEEMGEPFCSCCFSVTRFFCYVSGPRRSAGVLNGCSW
jgi:hypothetical protein